MHVREELVEQHVLDPQSLSEEERRRVDQHLEECSSCRAIHNYLKSYYAELMRVKPASSPELDNFLDCSPLNNE